jgi:S-DNA-T family DNA segregation ATPase FtsK/SpoIIIE
MEHIKFEEVLKENNKKHILYLGHNYYKEIRKVDLRDSSAIIITGETGSGKSILVDQIVCQLIKNNTSLDMEFYFIDSSGVELNLYAESRYAKDSALRDNRKAIEIIGKVLREMDYRKDYVHSKGYLTVDEYNEFNKDKISDIVLVIDDNDRFILNEDISKQLTALIDGGEETNIYLICAFSNTDNYFFKSNKNQYSPVLISFDMSDSEHSGYINIPGAEDLNIGKFYIIEDEKKKEYYNFDFEDKIIVDILNK